MIYKNFKNKVKNYWRKLENEKNFTVPNETIFRLLNHRKFNFKNKNVLDIGIGDGANLLEFYRRGSKIYGIDIRDSMLKKFYKTYNFPKKNYIAADLNNYFPKFKKKMDLINCKDTICYLESKKHYDFLISCKRNLNKNGILLIQYIQKQLLKKYQNYFDFNVKKNYSELKIYFNKSNPIPFLKDSHVKNIIKKTGMKVEKSIFDVTTHTKGTKEIIDINRFFLLRKKD